MDTTLRCLLLGLVMSLAGAFFLDTKRPILFQNNDRSFGHKVVQLGNRMMVSAPRFAEATNKTGRIYDCNPEDTRCSPITITGSADDFDISLGLSMASLQRPVQLLACGPTLQRTCGQNIYVNGRCYQLNQRLRVERSLSAPPPECGLDVVFVIDGSGSVGIVNFRTMTSFVAAIIYSFRATDTQFALMQYGHEVKTEFLFRRFSTEAEINTVNFRYQNGQATYTPTAMLQAVKNIFIPQSRKDARKLLIVITDGQSNDGAVTFQEATSKANEHGIQRIAIGVGAAFSPNNKRAYNELITIASSPDNVFQVNDFSALNEIQKRLQQKIFAIEGTQSLSGQSFENEFSQEGFSSFLTPFGALLGAVGAYGWTGGAYYYPQGQDKGSWINISTPALDMKDSYLGYSLLQVDSTLVVMGAPRYQHTGRVFVFRMNSQSSQWDPVSSALGDQIGSYFGSALGILKISSLKYLLVVGAPTYYSPAGPGGRVYLCPISYQEMTSRTPTTLTCTETLQGDSSQTMGHFGSAIAILPDMTANDYPDLAIGAPFEDNGQGALYIFPGKVDGFRTSYIQRITGSQLGSGVQFFGRSLVGDLDMTNDGLPDVTVGGEGVAFVLRSRPVLQVSVSMGFKPSEFPLSSYECTDKIQKQTTEILICFIRRLKSKGATDGILASVRYTLVLDAGRTQNRAVFLDRQTLNSRTISTSQNLINNQECVTYKMNLPECVEDSLTPLRVSLNFSLDGNPVLSDDSRNIYSEEIPFQKNCGADGVCVDELSMNISFSGLEQLVVGLLLDVNLTVSVTNKGDESYNARVLIPFPAGLSYRRVSLIQSNKRVTIACFTEENQRVVNCGVNRPLLRPNTTATFLVSFHVARTVDLGDSLTLTANVTSDNGRPANDLMKSSSTIKVLYSIYVTITSLDESSKYENFTSPEPRIKHVYQVKNLGVHQLPFSVTFLIPVRLGESIIWETPNISSSLPQLTTCRTLSKLEGPTNHQDLLKVNQVLNCSVGTCLRTVCNISNLKIGESVNFTISGPVTKDWETQTEVKKISIQSSAEIQYDPRMYFMEQNFTKAQAQTVLEVYVAYNYLPVIIRSSVGGFVLLLLITAGLYKLGFFKRQYKEMLENPGGETVGGDAATGPPGVPE
ncbi:integrin alpha-M-like [Leptodactylus fuscus]|uniref:integrin alpha-M-like n=1 Tax=Leptodactylus fuscus TaxID=238119 RepID=UPI003F4E8F42